MVLMVGEVGGDFIKCIWMMGYDNGCDGCMMGMMEIFCNNIVIFVCDLGDRMFVLFWFLGMSYEVWIYYYVYNNKLKFFLNLCWNM